MIHCIGYIVARLVIAVKIGIFKRKTGNRRRIKLTWRNDVNAHVLLFHNPVYLLEAQ